jgi:hypothetical protein
MFKFVLKVVDSFLQVLDPALFVTGSADVLDGIAEVEVEPLISDEIPDLDPTSPVVIRPCQIADEV